jgi:hypothetical protein
VDQVLIVSIFLFVIIHHYHLCFYILVNRYAHGYFFWVFYFLFLCKQLLVLLLWTSLIVMALAFILIAFLCYDIEICLFAWLSGP